MCWSKWNTAMIHLNVRWLLYPLAYTCPSTIFLRPSDFSHSLPLPQSCLFASLKSCALSPGCRHPWISSLHTSWMLFLLISSPWGTVIDKTIPLALHPSVKENSPFGNCGDLESQVMISLIKNPCRRHTGRRKNECVWRESSSTGAWGPVLWLQEKYIARWDQW